MLKTVLFDSRDVNYRSPFGAVEVGTSIHIRIRLPRHLRCSAATLVVLDDNAARQERFPMFWCGLDENDTEWWELDYTPSNIGLYFYWFEVNTNSQHRIISRGNGSQGVLTPTAERSWQLTVYEKGFATPDWPDGGIMYQIFPDSFCKAAEHDNFPDGRITMQWDEEPHWRPDHDGTIRNRHFYGGDLDGVISKLDYLHSLGVTCIYLNPIFESHENHRYSTADYSRIDPMLGDSDTFRRLCTEAKKLGMRVILDGVFSHTGCDSVYFNKNRRYDVDGAYNSPHSEYRSWYNFRNWPNDYASWWGFETLPELNEESEGVMRYINGEGGIAQRWLREGAGGWRLDVADELPDGFLDALRTAVKAQDPDAIIIGEVWEDASNKCAYSRRRRYLLGQQLDSVMNYCFRDAILTFLAGGDGRRAMDIIMSVVENYPPQVTRLLMNMLGTHDTERILTLLGGEPANGRGRDWQAHTHMSDSQRRHALDLYKLAVILQYTLPGFPSIYYGDEAGLEGYRDPFNRASFPWERENTELLSHHRTLAELRRGFDCFVGADITPVHADGRVMAYERGGECDRLFIALNADNCARTLALPDTFSDAQVVLGEQDSIHGDTLHIPEKSAVILHICAKE